MITYSQNLELCTVPIIVILILKISITCNFFLSIPVIYKASDNIYFCIEYIKFIHSILAEYMFYETKIGFTKNNVERLIETHTPRVHS